MAPDDQAHTERDEFDPKIATWTTEHATAFLNHMCDMDKEPVAALKYLMLFIAVICGECAKEGMESATLTEFCGMLQDYAAYVQTVRDLKENVH